MLIGKTVWHKSFGQGRIVCVDGSYLTIRFADKERRFVFPLAFECYLSTDDQDLRLEIEKAILSFRIEREKREAKEKKERAQLSRSGSVIPGRRIDEEIYGDGTPEDDMC